MSMPTTVNPALYNIDVQPSFFEQGSIHPLNSVVKLGNIMFFGAFFQFTAVDRAAWNNLVEFSDIPDPSQCLGAKWCRTTDILPKESYENHMPQATKQAKEHCAPYKPVSPDRTYTPGGYVA